MRLEYPEKIKKSVDVLCEELKNHYPELFLQTYDSCGNPSENGLQFHIRMQFGLYLELMKAGIKFSEKDFIVDENPKNSNALSS